MRRFLLSFAVVAGAGCGDKQPSIDDAIKKWSPKVDGKLAMADQIARSLDKVDATKAYAGPALSVLEELQRKITGDTLITYAPDLAALVADKPLPTDHDRHTSSKELVGCWYIMKKQQYGSFELSSSVTYGAFKAAPGRGFQVELLCEHLNRATHLAVVSPGATMHAAADVPDSSDTKAESFRRGKTSGVIDVFELASGNHLGRLPYSATNRGSVEYTTDSAGMGAAMDADAALSKDLREQTWNAIEDALLKR